MNVGKNIDDEFGTIWSEIDKLKSDFNLLRQSSEANVVDGRYYMDAAAQYLGVSKGTLYNYTSRQMIGFSRLGKTIVFTKKQLDDFIAAHTYRSWREIAIDFNTKQACRKN